MIVHECHNVCNVLIFDQVNVVTYTYKTHFKILKVHQKAVFAPSPPSPLPFSPKPRWRQKSLKGFHYNELAKGSTCSLRFPIVYRFCLTSSGVFPSFLITLRFVLNQLIVTLSRYVAWWPLFINHTGSRLILNLALPKNKLIRILSAAVVLCLIGVQLFTP